MKESLGKEELQAQSRGSKQVECVRLLVLLLPLHLVVGSTQ